MANKLVLVDGNSLFYRAFYALPPLQNENGEYTNAIYGFCNILTKIITDFKPTHLVVAFDAGKHTFRNDLYAEYKAFAALSSLRRGFKKGKRDRQVRVDYPLILRLFLCVCRAFDRRFGCA